MDFDHLLFSFEGRISRKSYWVGTIIVLAASMVLTMALGPLFGLSLRDLISSNPPARALKLDLLVNLIVLWPGLAITIKRLHDRNRPTRWVIILFFFFAATMVVEYMGFMGTPDTPNPIYLGLILSTLVVGLWLLIELGFVPGSKGVNEYGPDPLQSLSGNDAQEN